MYSDYDVFWYKSLTASKFYWVVGHGFTGPLFSRVPDNTWVVFLSKPGHTLHTEPFTTYMFKKRIVKDTELTRRIAIGTIPKDELPGIRLHGSSWKDYIYGPGDKLPATYITFKPPVEPSNFNSVIGVYDTSKPNNVKYRNTEESLLLSRVINNKPGIYFVATCRPTREQLLKKRDIWLASIDNKRKGFTQNNSIMLPDPSGIIQNIQKQNIERIKAQRVCRLNQSGYNQACGIVKNNSSPVPPRPSKRPYQKRPYEFAPGLSPTESQKRREKIKKMNNRRREKIKKMMAKKRV